MSQTFSYHVNESDLLEARQVFRAHESRDLFYQAARELIRLAIAGQTTLSVAEALATLLQTWNKSFYRFHETFDDQHFQSLTRVVEDTSGNWESWRARSIVSVERDESQNIEEVFAAFERILGPVGAAKALHLLCPAFFPLWDRTIASKYGVALKSRGENASQYLRFMEITKQQLSELGPTELESEELLKLVDEYNYCRFTKGWLAVTSHLK